MRRKVIFSALVASLGFSSGFAQIYPQTSTFPQTTAIPPTSVVPQTTAIPQTSVAQPTITPQTVTQVPVYQYPYVTNSTLYQPLPTTNLPGTPGFQTNSSQMLAPVTAPTSASQSLLPQLYPQPAKPKPIAETPTGEQPALVTREIPYETIAPPESYLPGLMTIRDRRWTTTDYFYNLPINIGVRVEVIKPQGRYMPISDKQIEKRVTGVFEDAGIDTVANILDCSPPLPVFQVIVMAYPCDRRCVGVITAQLFEEAKPARIDVDLNGVWQAITWERQALVATTCEEFAHEVGETVEQMAGAFADRFSYYHLPEEKPCFPLPPNEDQYRRYYRN